MRIAVLSDIHSNLVALDAVLDHAGGVDAIWQLGDVVGYGPDPDGVVARLAGRGAIGVRGNHDAAALGGPEIDWFNPEARAAVEWTRDVIRPETKAWLGGLDDRAVMGDITLVHGSPRDPLREYISTASVALDNLGVLETSHGLHGHTHIPIAWTLADGGEGRRPAAGVRLTEPGDGATFDFGTGRSLLNPGSVGQPRDGDPRASYLILDPDTHTVTWHRVAYDVGAVQAAMRVAGLPRRLVERLAFGA